MTAPSTPNVGITPTEGVDFAATYAISSSTPEYPGPPVAVGTHVLGTNGSEYVFCQASVALAAYQCVAIDKTQLVAVPMTITLLQTQVEVGWPQVAVAAGSYFWAAIRGQQVGVLAKKGAVAGGVVGTGNIQGKLFVSGTSPGVLTTTSVRTSAYVAGIVLTTSITSAMTGANPSAVGVATATWPRALF